MNQQRYIGNTYKVERLPVKARHGRLTITDEVEIVDYEKDEHGDFFVLVVAGTPKEDPHWEDHVMACDPIALLRQIDPAKLPAQRPKSRRYGRAAIRRRLGKAQKYRDIPPS